MTDTRSYQDLSTDPPEPETRPSDQVAWFIARGRWKKFSTLNEQIRITALPTRCLQNTMHAAKPKTIIIGHSCGG